MTRVAEMFGVELEEVFEVKDCDGLFRFNEHYLMHTDKYGVWQIDNDALGGILSGNHEIIKKPWKPSTGDSYYYIEATLDCNHIDVWQEIWKNTTVDMERYAVGNFFETREEASNSVNAYCNYLNNVVTDLSWHNNK